MHSDLLLLEGKPLTEVKWDLFALGISTSKVRIIPYGSTVTLEARPQDEITLWVEDGIVKKVS